MKNNTFSSFFSGYKFEILLLATVTMAHLYIAMSPSISLLTWYSNDDAYYYFKVAKNIASGLGSTFDGIGLTNGYHPLWLIICIPIFWLAKFDLVLPLRILVMVAALISGFTGILLYRLVSKRLSNLTGIFTAMFWCFYIGVHAIVTTGGMESGVSAFFIAWLLYRISLVDHTSEKKWIQPKFIITGLIAAFAIMSRLDNIYIAVIAGAWLLFDNSKTKSWLVLDIAAIPLLLIASYFIRLGGAEGFFFYANTAYWYIAILLLIKIPVYYFLGLYHPDRMNIQLMWQKVIIALVVPALISFATLLILQAVGVVSSFPRSIVFVDMGLTFFWLMVTRFLYSIKHENPSALPKFRLANFEQVIKKIQKAVSYAIPNAAFLGAYVIINKLVFGNFTPVSGQIKHWWSTLVNPIYGRVASNFGEVIGFPDNADTSWSLFLTGTRLLSNKLAVIFHTSTKYERTLIDLFSVFLFLVLVYLLIRKNIGYWNDRANLLGVLPLFSACLIQVLYYGVSGYVHTRAWYWIGELVLGVLVIALLVDALLFFIMNYADIRVARILVAASSLGLVVSLSVRIVQYFPYEVTGRSENPFKLQARALEEATPPGSLIGTTGGGGLSYFINGRTIVNLDGLMNSKEYFDLLKVGKADHYLDKIGLDYVYEKKYVVEESDPYRTFLPEHLVRIARIYNLPLFEYVVGVE